MKIRSKLIPVAVAAVALFSATQVKAQITPAKSFVLSLSAEPGLPTGAQTPYSAFILGGTVRLQYGIINNLAATVSTGGYHFFSKTIPGTDTKYASFGVGPVKAGLKYFFIPNIYIDAEAGEGVEVTQNGFSGGEKKLLICPSLGYAAKHWDFAAQYTSLSGQQFNYGFAGLRVAYGFGL